MEAIDQTQGHSVTDDMERIFGASGPRPGTGGVGEVKSGLPVVIAKPSQPRRRLAGVLVAAGVAVAVPAVLLLKPAAPTATSTQIASPAAVPSRVVTAAPVAPGFEPGTGSRTLSIDGEGAPASQTPEPAPTIAIEVAPPAERIASCSDDAVPRAPASSVGRSVTVAVAKPRADVVPRPARTARADDAARPVMRPARTKDSLPAAQTKREQARSDLLAPLPQPECRSGRLSDDCIYGDVRAADRRLLAAYLDATHAGVPIGTLQSVRRDWSRARDVSLRSPDEMIRRYDALTRELRAAARSE